MSFDRTYQRTSTRNRRPLYAPPPTRGNQSHHSLFGYWVPLIVTGTIAVGGVAAWIWNERREHHDDDHRPQDKPPRPPTGPGGPYPPHASYPGPPPPVGPPGSQGAPGTPYYPPSSGPPGPPPAGGESASYYGASQSGQNRSASQQQDESTWYGRVGGIMKRAPSPQQFFDSASKQVSAGMAVAGSALGSIWEGDEEQKQRYDQQSAGRRSDRRSGSRVDEREGFSDHERWSEEAEGHTKITTVDRESAQRAEAAARSARTEGKGRAKRAVAIVINADALTDINEDVQTSFRMEHASVLSHLPAREESSNTDVFVLIYAPNLKSLPPVDYKPGAAASTLGSAYSQISTPATTPGNELQSISPRVHTADHEAPGKQFDLLYAQAQTLVSGPTRILPFTTPDGYVYILRHLGPQFAYVSDTVSGKEGEYISQLNGWVGQTILVAGDEGHGGLADTETEDEGGAHGARRHRWYDNSSLVGLGKGVEVVDAGRVGEDWTRRVGGRE